MPPRPRAPSERNTRWSRWLPRMSARWAVVAGPCDPLEVPWPGEHHLGNTRHVPHRYALAVLRLRAHGAGIHQGPGPLAGMAPSVAGAACVERKDVLPRRAVCGTDEPPREGLSERSRRVSRAARPPMSERVSWPPGRSRRALRRKMIGPCAVLIGGVWRAWVPPGSRESASVCGFQDEKPKRAAGLAAWKHGAMTTDSPAEQSLGVEPTPVGQRQEGIGSR